MRFLAIAIVCASVACWCQSSPSHRVEKANHPDSNKAETNRAAKTLSSPSTGDIGNKQAAQISGNTDAKPYDRFDAVAPATWSNWALVIVGMVASWIAIRALYATEQAAIAAMASADAVANIERPWIVFDSADHGWESQLDSGGIRQQHTAVYWKVKNIGKTPAFILAVEGGIDFLPDPNRDLPLNPRYYIAERAFDDPLIPAERQSPKFTTIRERIYGVPEWTEFTSGNLVMVFWGRVEYGDPIQIGTKKDPHETRFCYLYRASASGFTEMCGSPSYNRHT